MRKPFILTLLLLAVAGIWLASALLSHPIRAQQPAAPQQVSLSWDVVASGGATMSSGSYTLLSTTGQPVVGASSNTEHTLLSGYWQEFARIWKLLMPIVAK